MKVSVLDYAVSCATGGLTRTAMDSIFEGRTGLTTEGGRILGRVAQPLEPLPEDLAAYDTRQARLALSAAQQISPAIVKSREKWGPDRIAVLLGTSTGGIQWVESTYVPGTKDEVAALAGSALTRHGFAAAPRVIQAVFELSGPAYAISTACSSSAHVFGAARRMLLGGRVDAVIALGVDTVCQLTIQGFRGLGLLAVDYCRPFDVARDGINIGEAAAAFLLERDASEADFYLKGFGSSSDGFHSTRPPPDGAGAVTSMSAALADAALAPTDIKGVHAHGTGTVENDRAEARAITRVFGEGMSITSTKGLTGHTLGACGALSAAIVLESLKRQQLPGTFGLKTLDPTLSVCADPRPIDFYGDFVASNSFAFGGNNVTLIFGRSR